MGQHTPSPTNKWTLDEATRDRAIRMTLDVIREEIDRRRKAEAAL
ncbi:MAG: hypothetical protein QM692_03425 [Thermomicrobiales bacterium]